MSLSLTAKSMCLFKYTSQSSSHSCPIDMSDALFKPGRIIAVEAMTDNLFDIGIIPLFVDEILSLFSSSNKGPEMFRISVKTFFILVSPVMMARRLSPLDTMVSVSIVCSVDEITEVDK